MLDATQVSSMSQSSPNTYRSADGGENAGVARTKTTSQSQWARLVSSKPSSKSVSEMVS
jgi:hypothetical protein